MNEIKVGVIGAGYFGKFHAEKYRRIPQTKLVGIVDTNPERARAVALQNDTRAFFDQADLYDQVDAVSVVVPTPQHYAVAAEFLRR